ncbi:MAG: hypothetical protein K2I49_01125 [Ureaplasma sp.]|nr:hypothetical protein [Ureaplasma sp.]
MRQKNKIGIILGSVGLTTISVATPLIVTSCGVFEPTVNPDLPPSSNSPPNNGTNNQIIDYSSSESITKIYESTLNNISFWYNKNFCGSTKPEQNFPKFDNYLNLYLGYEQNNKSLLNDLNNKFDEWYKNDDANYLTVAIPNFLSILLEIPKIYWYGLNLVALSFYEYCNQNKNTEDEKEIFAYLPLPISQTPYIDLLNSVVTRNITNNHFMLYWPNIILNFHNQYISNKFNNLVYYINSIEFSLNFNKKLMLSPIPKSFQYQITPSKPTSTIPNLYEFYSNGQDEKTKKENETRIQKNFQDGINLIEISKINYLKFLEKKGET